MSKVSSGAQGTIEYLVILSVVIVISLVVVGLSTNILSANSTQVGITSGKISGKVGSGGISITESVTDPRGDAVLSLSNNSGGNITLTKITPLDSRGNAGVASNYSTTITQGSSRTFSLSDINTSCPCNARDTIKTCTFRFTITTDAGLQQDLTASVTTNCATDTNPTNPRGVVGLGSGTLADPWIINSCKELQNMNSRLDGNYTLGADLNCWETRNWNAGLGFASIGNDSTPFMGSFNGNSHTITSLYINRPSTDYVGLFGYVYGSGIRSISNIGLIDVNATGNEFVGGLVGEQEDNTITNSYSTGNVTGNGTLDSYEIGGLVGYSTYGAITNSYSTGSVTAGSDSSAIGGLVGNCRYSGCIITNSYSTGSVTAGLDSYYVGGLVGSLRYPTTITNSYSTGNVTGSDSVGGLVGIARQGGTITSSYSTGSVTGSTSVGGLVGYKYNDGTTVNNSYWDKTTSGKTVMCGFGSCEDANGMTTAQMKQQATFTGWDFATIWNIAEATSYPYFR